MTYTEWIKTIDVKNKTFMNHNIYYFIRTGNEKVVLEMISLIDYEDIIDIVKEMKINEMDWRKIL